MNYSQIKTISSSVINNSTPLLLLHSGINKYNINKLLGPSRSYNTGKTLCLGPIQNKTYKPFSKNINDLRNCNKIVNTQLYQRFYGSQPELQEPDRLLDQENRREYESVPLPLHNKSLKEEESTTNKISGKEEGKTNEEEIEDELTALLNTDDNFFVREWKELKSFVWHLVFGSQVLVHEAQQALELKQKRINNVPLSRRESLLIRRSFHDTICVLPFFLFLAIEPYYLFLVTSIFPSLVPSVYVTPHILKRNLEKNKKSRKRIAKSASKLEPWVPFDVKVLHDEKQIFQLSKTDKLKLKQFDVDTLSWWHLKSCAGYLGLYGMLPKTILKIRIDEYLDYIKSDDEFIHEEGIESLTLDELRLANEQRGYNALGLPKEKLISNLNHWIHFFYNDENIEIPRMVMILSHIYSDNVIFQTEIQKRKELRKQRRKELLNKFKFYSNNK